MISKFAEFKSQVGLICAIDHSSRAGNYFFQSIFDTHSQVLVCPWIQYDYSYLFARFGEQIELDAVAAHSYWSTTAYFNMVYQDLTNNLKQKIISFGSDPDVKINREVVREVFDSLVLANPTITRRDLLLASKYAFAIGIGRTIEPIKYILISDAISLRSEDPINGFSFAISHLVQQDFPDVRFISLERDPRATIASCRQQYLIQNGNMHSVKWGTFWLRISSLLRMHFSTESSVFIYFLLYTAAAARRMYDFKAKNSVLTLRNEDLNCEFAHTMQDLCTQLNIEFDPLWVDPNYSPTNVGLPWRGKGAYNPLYYKGQVGTLTANLDQQELNLARPNAYVTRRWRTQLPINEIGIIEFLFREELNDLGYEFIVFTGKKYSKMKLIRYTCQPFLGEIPTLKWLFSGKDLSRSEVFNRLFYTATLPAFYVVSRIILLVIILRGRHFKLRR